jgi:hypothetical protein
MEATLQTIDVAALDQRCGDDWLIHAGRASM